MTEIDLAKPHPPLPAAVMRKLEFVPQFFIVNTRDGNVTTVQNMLNTPEGFNEIKGWATK